MMGRMRIGFTSVTFRGKSVEEIVALAVKAGADGIEWGGDVHVPHGDEITAAEVREQCRDNGLAVLSYGSYLRCKEGEDVCAVVRTAACLGASRFRVWAYDKPPSQVTEAEFDGVVGALRRMCRIAADAGLTVALEYHRGTLTETYHSAMRLIHAVGQENLQAYWQPNPELSPETHHREIETLCPYLAAFHVFNWRREGERDIRYPLREARPLWERYVTSAHRDAIDLILEFVKDDTERQFLDDMDTLSDVRRGFVAR